MHDSTHFAVPAILTGSAPRAGADAPNYLTHPRSLFTYLDRLGYRIRAREEATTVCPPRLCPRADRYGNPHYNILHRRRERLDRTIAGLRRSRRPTLTFHHSVLPHVPWAYLPSGQARQGYRAGALPDFASPAGFGDGFLTQFNEQRHLLQAGFTDHEVGRLVARLKKTGQWKQALVVVTADQAISFQRGVADRRQVTEANIHEVAPVPLFVKRPGQTRAGRSSAYVSGLDVLPTIAALLGRPLGGQADGAERVQPRRPVAARGPDAAPSTCPASSPCPRARWRPAAAWTACAAATCSATARWSRVYRIGPHRQLLGRRVAEPKRSPASARPSPASPRRRPSPRWTPRQPDPHAGRRADRGRIAQRRPRSGAHRERPRGRGRPQLPPGRRPDRVVRAEPAAFRPATGDATG